MCHVVTDDQWHTVPHIVDDTDAAQHVGRQGTCSVKATGTLQFGTTSSLDPRFTPRIAVHQAVYR